MNNKERAKFWVEFIFQKGKYSNPVALKEQFNSGEFSEFCDCGCNSFKVKVPKSQKIKPIATAGAYGPFHECNYFLEEEDKTLEIILFADEEGYLTYVEIDCSANSFPVPEIINVKGEPFHVQESRQVTLKQTNPADAEHPLKKWTPCLR